MKLFDRLFRGAKKIQKLEARINELKASRVGIQERRDEFKRRAHAAEDALRQSQRAAETEIHRCTHYLAESLESLPAELDSFSRAFADVSPVIDVGDDMIWSSSSDVYFQVGRDAMRILAKACDKYLGRVPEVVLDLPCGHGRVMRWLRQAYPEARLMGCDTQLNGMDFCNRLFGSLIVQPADKPSEMACPQRADLIWIGSLFTHLPEAEFVAFLKYLPNLLSDGGIVVFTTHGNEAMERLGRGEDFHIQNIDRGAIEEANAARGFAYVAYEKTPDYGVSFSSREFIQSHIDTLPEVENHSDFEELWCGFQDVFVCQKVG